MNGKKSATNNKQIFDLINNWFNFICKYLQNFIYIYMQAFYEKIHGKFLKEPITLKSVVLL